MSRKKIGPEVDENVWEEFREYVDRERGGVRGKLGPELEKAMLEYMDQTQLAEIEQQLDDINHRLDRLDRRLDRLEEALNEE